MKTIVYPLLTASLGGAVSVKYNAKSAWVTLHDRTIRLPLKELNRILDDGMRVAEKAITYAYRNH